MRRALISWTIGFALLILAFFGALALLNSTLYSAHGFVSSYLDALARHDATTARELPGVRAPRGAATNLLTDGALVMTDGERIEAIHGIDADTRQQYRFVESFTNQTDMLLQQRQQEGGNIGSIRGMYGLP